MYPNTLRNGQDFLQREVLRVDTPDMMKTIGEYFAGAREEGEEYLEAAQVLANPERMRFIYEDATRAETDFYQECVRAFQGAAPNNGAANIPNAFLDDDDDADDDDGRDANI